MEFDFTDKRILVTGGTRGIGRATVETFLKKRARVAVNGSSATSVGRALAELDAGERAVAAPGNLGLVPECQRVVEAAVSALGGLDVLVNNAGVSRPGRPIEETTAEEWDAIINVNLRAAYFCTKYAIPSLRAAKGNIVTVASILGIRGNGAGDSVYCASKGGVVNLTRDLAIELGPDIRVNCLCPGAIDTEMLQELGRYLGGGDLASGYKTLNESALMKRVGRTAEMANVILYLASDLASFVTGSIHVADGGAVAKV